MLELTLVAVDHTLYDVKIRCMLDEYMCYFASSMKYGCIPEYRHTYVRIVYNLRDEDKTFLVLNGHRVYSLEDNALDIVYSHMSKEGKVFRYNIPLDIVEEVRIFFGQKHIWQN